MDTLTGTELNDLENKALKELGRRRFKNRPKPSPQELPPTPPEEKRNWLSIPEADSVSRQLSLELDENAAQALSIEFSASTGVLTPRHMKFVEEYLKEFNVRKAVIAAGYETEKPYALGQLLLERPEIQQALKELTLQELEDTVVTLDFIIKGLKQEAEGKGKDSNARSRISALELLGKHLGMFTEKIEEKKEVTVRFVNDWRKPPPVVLEADYEVEDE